MLSSSDSGKKAGLLEGKEKKKKGCYKNWYNKDTVQGHNQVSSGFLWSIFFLLREKFDFLSASTTLVF